MKKTKDTDKAYWMALGKRMGWALYHNDGREHATFVTGLDSDRKEWLELTGRQRDCLMEKLKGKWA